MRLEIAPGSTFTNLYAEPMCLDEKLASSNIRDAENSLRRAQNALAVSEEQSGNSAVRSGALLGGELTPVPAAIREQVNSAAEYFANSVEKLSQAMLSCSARELRVDQKEQLATDGNKLKTPLNELRSASDEALVSETQAFAQTGSESSSEVSHGDWLFGYGE